LFMKGSERAVTVPEISSSEGYKQQEVRHDPGRVYEFAGIEEYEAVSQYGSLPGCLQGTRIDGRLAVDAQGNLIIDREMRSLFDYFLSAIVEEGLDKVVGRIEEYIMLTLPAPASEKAMEVFHAYMDYSRSLQRFFPTVNADTDRKAFIAELKAAVSERRFSRRKYLPPEVVKAFFTEEETYDEFTLKRLEVEGDDALSEAEKERKVYALEEMLPVATKVDRRHFRKEIALNKQIEDLQKTQGNENQIYELRKGFYGSQAADRMADLDRKRSDLIRRIDSYRESKEMIMNMPSLTEQGRQIRIQDLEKKLFSEEELMEVHIREGSVAAATQ